MSNLLNLNRGFFTESLLLRGNNPVNMSLGPGVNPLNHENTVVKRGCVVAID